MFNRISGTVPMVGVLLFVLLYFYSASLYSTATTLDLVNPGYKHFDNYWCDLYVPVTYTGQVNPGRPYAMAATFILAAALGFFFLSVPVLFAEFTWLCLTVRGSGVLSMAIASIIFTPLHNLVITVGVPLGALAVAATCVGLARKRQWILLSLALWAVSICVFDYGIWKLQLLRPQQPAIQKAAFFSLFLWVVCAAVRVVLPSPVRRREMVTECSTSQAG